MESTLINRLSTLSHPHRMDVFRLLMRRCPDEVPAGEIAKILNLKASTASTYLAALSQSGLISQRREGTKLLYAVQLNAVRDVVGGLFLDCCRGRADLCPPQLSDILKIATPNENKKYNVLFVCSGNSARSIIAESLLRTHAGNKFEAYSAGTAHKFELNPFALQTLMQNGHNITPLHSKNVEVFRKANAPKMDFVFTVCDRAANEECPTWHGQPVSSHWGLPDPAQVEGDDLQKQQAFQQTYSTLLNRITSFASLSFDALDRATLQTSIDVIGTTHLNSDKEL